MLSIWMIWRVGETDLRALTTISRVLDHFGEKAASIFYPSREIDPNSTIFGLSLGSKYVFGTYVGEKRQLMFFGYIFSIFYVPLCPAGA